MDEKALENLLKILLAGGSLTLGAFLTALRAKLANTKKKNWLHVSFYIVSSAVLLLAVFVVFKYWSAIIKPDWFVITVVFIAIISSLLLMWVTNKFLAGKYQYTIDKLNPVVNAFSQNADRANIKLLAGNLDFFGKSEHEIEQHPQYVELRRIAFDEIHILCTPPISLDDKRRYGKIITDMPSVKFRYYKPSHADLKVRGRIKTLNNVTILLIYTKVSPGRYQALELNTAETDGALYSHLWNLIWDIADAPNAEQLAEYKKLYRPL